MDQVVIPTAERGQSERPGPRRSVVVLAAVLLAGVVLWPDPRLSPAPGPSAPEMEAFAPPPLGPLAASRTPLWQQVAPLPASASRVVGVGGLLVAVSPGEIWSFAILQESAWVPLSGLPVRFLPVAQLVVPSDAGFAVVGRFRGRTVVFDFASDGRFGGARTVPGIDADAVAGGYGSLFVFDAVEPVAARLGPELEMFPTPGTVVQAVVGPNALVVLTVDGAVHLSTDQGKGWELLGDGFRALAATDEAIVAVGASVTVGLQRVENRRLVRLEGAPFGPTVAWSSGIGVHDWSTDSVWHSGDLDGWERYPLWSRHGFTDSFADMVSGTDRPHVVATDAAGVRVVWRGG